MELERLRSLQRDLLDFSESRLTNIDRLLSDLDAHIQAFRDLLDKPAKSDASRKTLNAGAIPILRRIILKALLTKTTMRIRYYRVQRSQLSTQC